MSLLTHRRALLSAKGKVLPYAYQQVEWLESTGTQYIDTGFKLNQDSRVILDFLYTNEQSSARVFGARTTSLSRGYTISSTSGTLRPPQSGDDLCVSPQYGSQSGVITSSTLLKNTRYYLDFNKNVFVMTSENYVTSKTFYYENFATEANCLLFASKNGVNGIVYAIAKIYSAKIYDNGTLFREFIPCYRKADNKAGLYDLVNGEFYTNKGTGEFILGNEIAN